MRKRFSLIGMVLGGLGWVIFNYNFSSEFIWLLCVFSPIQILVGFGGAVGFVIGDVVDHIQNQRRFSQIKKRYFWRGFMIGGVGTLIVISSYILIYVGRLKIMAACWKMGLSFWQQRLLSSFYLV